VTVAAVRGLRFDFLSRGIGGLACSVALVAAFSACKRAADNGGAARTATEENSAEAADPKVIAAVRELAAVLDKALSAYNAGDQAALFADFATTATPPASDRIFAELFEGYYKVEFGKIVALRLNTRESSPDADFGMLVYDAKCEKQPLAKVSANFIREKGAPKIVQLRLEKVEPVAK
jgi:hypothetical protein